MTGGVATSALRVRRGIAGRCRVRYSVLACCLLAALSGCQRKAAPARVAAAPATAAIGPANSATLTTGPDGRKRLEVVLVTDSAAYAMGRGVQTFLRELVKERDAIAELASIRFIVNERLIDAYGKQSAAATASFEISMSDILRMDLDAMTTFAVMNFAHDMTITHPAAVQDIDAFCDGENGRYASRFCAIAHDAPRRFEHAAGT